MLLLLASLQAASANSAERSITVGSKNFSEGYLLAEIMAQLLEARDFQVRRRFGLGGTLICYEALLKGEIDVYPEYSGTVLQAILKMDRLPAEQELNDVLQPLQIEALPQPESAEMSLNLFPSASVQTQGGGISISRLISSFRSTPTSFSTTLE